MTNPCPEIATYKRQSANSGVLWIARFIRLVTPIKPAGAPPRWEALPLVFEGLCEEAVIARAQNWWAAEQQREIDRAVLSEARRQRMTAIRASRSSGVTP